MIHTYISISIKVFNFLSKKRKSQEVSVFSSTCLVLPNKVIKVVFYIVMLRINKIMSTFLLLLFYDNNNKNLSKNA